MKPAKPIIYMAEANQHAGEIKEQIGNLAQPGIPY
ncbi:putative phosphatase [Pedobacter zeae]|uniref:Putative phosphatase n=1 Tax=Pedobacter zeae TaxID=1737356 RepID=A0A7W6KAY5_9SPHI|nr:putative phosphatase [Pedobacter zeae]